MLTAKKWEPATYHVPGGGEITMKLKRLDYGEASELNLLILRSLGAIGNITEESGPDEQVAALERFQRALPAAAAKKAFEDYVRDVSGIEDEDGSITTGAGLYVVADERLVAFVVGKLRSMARLGANLGKGSPSPSGSSQNGEASPSSSPATSTATEAGTAPSTAPETLVAQSSSIGPE